MGVVGVGLSYSLPPALLEEEKRDHLERVELGTAVNSLFILNRPLLLSEDEEDTKRVVRSAKDKR